MGSLIGGLITKKKRKKIRRALQAEYLSSAAAQKEVNRLDLLQANFGVRQEQLQQLREGRVLRAAAISSAANAGALGSSAILGGAGSAYTTALANASSLNVYQTFSDLISQQNAILAESQAQQAILSGRMENQLQTSQMIGGAIDTGIALLAGTGVASKLF